MNAIIQCAGKGTRLFPFTQHHPKPLLRVNGEALIERSIEILKRHGIDEIICVVGYKSEQFNYLRQKYGVRLCLNPNFETQNNRSSILAAAQYLGDSLILDGDLFFTTDFLDGLRFDHSFFLCQETHGYEWEVLCDQDEHLTAVKKNSTQGYCISGVSYWTKNDAKALLMELEKGNSDEYWEDAALRLATYSPITIHKTRDFQIEIDSFKDALQRKVLTPDEIAKQCDEDGFLSRLKGMTNNSYLIRFNQQKYALRIPGEQTDSFLNRSFEPQIVEYLNQFSNLTPKSQYWGDGFKVCQFLEGYRSLNRQTLQEDEIRLVAQRLKQLHQLDCKPVCNCSLDLQDEMRRYERLAGVDLLSEKERDWLLEQCRRLNEYQVLAHRDLVLENIMLKRDRHDLKFIDFEYASVCSLYWDLAAFILEADLSDQEERIFLKEYGVINSTLLASAKILVDYIWGLWGFYMKLPAYGRGRIVRMHERLISVAK